MNEPTNKTDPSDLKLAFTLNDAGEILYQDVVLAKLCAGSHFLTPNLNWLDDTKTDMAEPLNQWLGQLIADALAPLLQLQQKIQAKVFADEVLALAVRLLEQYGALNRRAVAKDIRALSQEQRGFLRQCGVRFGEFSLFFPLLLRPAPARLLAMLRAFGPGGDQMVYIAPAGLTSLAGQEGVAPLALSAAGFHKCGNRFIRLDVLERIGDEIRTAKQKPDMSIAGGFQPSLEMVALLGCSKPDLDGILSSLGYVCRQVAKDESGAVDELGCIWAMRQHTKPAHNANKKNAKKRPAKPKAKQHPPRKEPKIDPDSPFAVLQSLDLNNN